MTPGFPSFSVRAKGQKLWPIVRLIDREILRRIALRLTPIADTARFQAVPHPDSRWFIAGFVKSVFQLFRCNMSISETKSETRSKFLGDPPLTRRDIAEDYNALNEQVKNHIKPEGFLGDLTVRDLTDAIWEGQRYKRYQSNLIESAFHTALIQTLTRILKTDEWAARVEATKWYSDNVEERRSVLNLLTRFGISVETLYATAMSLNAAPITVLERMISNRKSSRSKLLKDHNRLLRRIETAEGLTIDSIEI
jgi:hypothetical protein